MPMLNIFTPINSTTNPQAVKEGAVSVIDALFDPIGRVWVKRPGLCKWPTSAGLNAVRGIYDWTEKGKFVVVADGYLWVWIGTAFKQLSYGLPAPDHQASFASNGHWLYVATGGKLIRWDGESSTAAFDESQYAPVGCTHVAELDGYIIANENGTNNYIIGEPDLESALNPIVWNPSIGMSKTGASDNILSLAVAWRELIVVGSRTTEFHYNTGNADAPISRIEGAFIEQGTLSPYSLQKLGNNWIWLNAKREFILIEGRSPKVISLSISDLIKNLVCVYDATSFVVDRFYICTFPTDEITFVYDPLSDTWYRWLNWNEERNQYSSYIPRCSAFSGTFGGWVVGGKSGGSVYNWHERYGKDNDEPIRMEITSAAHDHGTLKTKTASMVRVQMHKKEPMICNGGGGVTIPPCTYVEVDCPYFAGKRIRSITGLPNGITFNEANQIILGDSCASGGYFPTLIWDDGSVTSWKVTVATVSLTIRFED